MLDEDTGAEPRIEYASIADPYILLVRDDASIFIAKMDNNLELEELERDDTSLTSKRWITGCLYEDKLGVFLRTPSDKGAKYGENIVMFLLSKTGALYVRRVDSKDVAVH
jgi:cleavage and polyadenylation specificity factor subunit 1